jgi:hypothetical protein
MDQFTAVRVVATLRLAPEVKRLFLSISRWPATDFIKSQRRTAMRLRPNEHCPIHKSISCCGREPVPKLRTIRLGVQRIEDPHHPRGYRELRSPAEMRNLLNRKIVEQDRKCAICHEEFTDYNDIVPDHRDPKGMGGAWRDDHPDNIQATHWWCNEQKGSTRMDP